MRRKLYALSALVAAISGGVYGQYEVPNEYAPIEARYISAGAMTRDFAPRSGYTGGDSLAIDYNAWMPVVGYHQGPVDVQFGYTRYSLKGATCSAVFFAVTGTNDVPLVHDEPASLVMPLLFSVDYTKSESSGPGRKHFIVASLGLGAGLKARLRGRGIEFLSQAHAAYHYSFEGFDTGNGTSLVLNAEATLLLRSIHIADGIVVGYRFRHHIWTLGDGRLDYRLTTHGPYIGVLL